MTYDKVQFSVPGKGDVLLVFGERVEGDVRTPVAATGWVSATTNHFGPEAYDAGTGHRRDDAVPRSMTDEEKLAYAVRLLDAA